MPRIQASSALSRLRVLDLSRVRAGPVCARHFADFGADVIKVETAGDEDLGGARHGSDFQNLHRNKRSIAIDLKSPAGKNVFLTLVRTADVVIENYRPDVKDRLGIDYASLREINPRIILASISGFGQDGPYRDRPGFDQIARQGPMRAGAAVADVTAGLQAALGIMTAIVERETTGEGQWVQSNLLQAGLTLLDFQAARYTMDGQVPPQVGNDHPTSMPTSAYRTADGFINVAAAGSAIWKRLCDAIGRPDLMSDPRFASAQGRATHRTALAEEINAVLASRPSLEWVESLNAAGVPCGPIHAMDEVFADAQVRHLNAAVAVEHPTLGTLNILNQAIKLSRTPGAVVTATPERGEHSDEILGEIGLSAAQVAELRASGAIR